MLEEQLTLLRVAVLEDGGLDPTIRDDLGRLIERFHRELEQTARRPAPELARWIHSLGFALYEQLGASLEPAWARRWIYLDLQIEAHLRLNGLGETIDQVYGLPWAKAG